MTFKQYMTDGEKVFKLTKGQTLTFPQEEIVKEHEELIDTLQEHQAKLPSKDPKLKKLIGEQSKELGAYKKGETEVEEDFAAKKKPKRHVRIRGGKPYQAGKGAPKKESTMQAKIWQALLKEGKSREEISKMPPREFAREGMAAYRRQQEALKPMMIPVRAQGVEEARRQMREREVKAEKKRSKKMKEKRERIAKRREMLDRIEEKLNLKPAEKIGYYDLPRALPSGKIIPRPESPGFREGYQSVKPLKERDTEEK